MRAGNLITLLTVSIAELSRSTYPICKQVKRHWLDLPGGRPSSHP
jgi:hypothetical protein